MTGRLQALRWALVAAAVASAAACLDTWRPTGPYRCPEAGCTGGMICDDGVCCLPGGAPACRTRPFEGRCPNGDTPKPYYVDADSDGVGDSARSELLCAQPLRDSVRWVLQGGDCDDRRPTVKPGQPEACNGLDDDCDGRPDWTADGKNRLSSWFRDADGDGYGDSANSVELCISLDAGYAPVGGDCQDQNPQVHPGRQELCNGLDDNCNERTDESPVQDTFDLGLDPVDFAACTAGLGECAQGNEVCRQGLRVCVPRRSGVTDVCNGLNDDCDADGADEQPGCGGPQQLTRTPGTVTARLLQLPSTQVNGCLLDTVDGGVSTWASPVWNTSMGLHPTNNDGTAPVLVQLWTLTAPPGEVWDLSQATSFDLGLELQPIVNFEYEDGGTLTLPFWGAAGRFEQPVVQLCSESGALLFQARPTATTLPALVRLPDGGIPAPETYRAQLSLTGATAGWTGGWRGTERRVRRLELLLSHQTISAATTRGGSFVTTGLRFLSTTGFVK